MKSPAEQLIDSYIEQHTPGVQKAIRRKLDNPSRVCQNCDFPVPKYPGRYPSKCGYCGEPLSSDKD